jgi:Uma2 family endonuclease
MGLYRANTPGVNGGISSSIRLDMDNEPQPDGVLFLDHDRGGHAFIDEEGYIAGAPELAAEVSASTIRLDMTRKLKVYRRNEIREYLIWRVRKKIVNWYALTAGKLDPEALVNGDLYQVQEVLQQGLRSSEHAQFVARLQTAGS